MPRFSRESWEINNTVSWKLQGVLSGAIELIDFKSISGRRTTEEQKELYRTRKTTLDGVTKRSKHQADPPALAKAIDIAPWPVQWPDEENISEKEKQHRIKRFHVLAGVILGVAHCRGVKLRWGGDWDGDWIYKDQEFHDLGHFELVEE